MKFLRLLLVSILLAVPMMAYAGPPAQSGPNVFRGMYPAWWWYSDGELIVVHGLDVIQGCIDGEIALELWEGKAVLNPRDEYLRIVQLKGDIGTWVHPWGLFEFNPDGSIDAFGTCFNVFTQPEVYGVPLASGLAKVITTDNNTQALMTESNRSKAWHLSAHGFLDTPDGGQILLNGGFNCRWSGDPAQEPRCRIRLIVE